MHRRLMVLAVVAVAGLAGCGGDDEDAAASSRGKAVVTIEAFQFEPDPVVVEAGTTITFVNRDAIDHTVTAGTRERPEAGRFDAELPGRGDSFELAFDRPGTYEYFCRVHPGPGMTASVTVR